MKVGDLVMLIGTDGFMPNLGSIGEIVEPFDGEDFGVLFPSWPCPVPPGIQWYVPPCWLMLIPPESMSGNGVSSVLPLAEIHC